MPKTLEFDQEVSDQIVALKNEDYKWGEISTTVELPVGKCMLIFNHATVAKKDRIKNATPEQVQALRDDESLSWGVISARTGYPESSCRGMYEDATGNTTKGNRIGKGGRHPGQPGEGGASKPKAATQKAASKKSTTAASAKESVIADLDADELKEKLTGYAIKVMTDSGDEIIKVKAVTRVNKASVVLKDEEGKARTVKKAAVFQVSKKKAIKGA